MTRDTRKPAVPETICKDCGHPGSAHGVWDGCRLCACDGFPLPRAEAPQPDSPPQVCPGEDARDNAAALRAQPDSPPAEPLSGPELQALADADQAEAYDRALDIASERIFQPVITRAGEPAPTAEPPKPGYTDGGEEPYGLCEATTFMGRGDEWFLLEWWGDDIGWAVYRLPDHSLYACDSGPTIEPVHVEIDPADIAAVYAHDCGNPDCPVPHRRTK